MGQMDDNPGSPGGEEIEYRTPSGDRFDMSGDFRGAVINIKSTILSEPKVREIEDLPPEPGDSPYLGLQYFEEKDADHFFGREVLTASIVNRLSQERFLAIIGASGSGKSSLVRAGIIPALRKGERLADGSLPPTASQRWDIRIFTPTAHPLEALAATLLKESGSLSAISELREELSSSPSSLAAAVQLSLAKSGARHFLLVVDQFEEIFTLCRHAEERDAFIAAILAAADPEDRRPVTILPVLRADFYAQLDIQDMLRELVSQKQEYIGAMSRDELFRAIVHPLALGNWQIQKGLVDVILDDVEGEPGALPLLSHALLETWKRRRGRTLILSGYKESGGVRGAIAQTAEAVFHQRLTLEQRPIAQMIFVRLAELGVNSQDTRRRAAFSELLTVATDERVIQLVVDILAETRLITTGVLPPGGEKVVEVAHEALIREWPTLRAWLDENRESLILHRQLTADASDWIKLDKDPGLLYRGRRLRQMEAWSEHHSVSISLIEGEFLGASLTAERQEMDKIRRYERGRRVQRLSLGFSGGLAIVLVFSLLSYSGILFNFRTPAKMEGIYNIAVAEIGLIGQQGEFLPAQQDAGKRLSEWLAGYLEEELASDPNIWIWVDGTQLRRLNVSIGRVDPSGEEPETEPASAIASRLNANMIVYGSIDSRQNPARLVLEFWLTPQDYSSFEEVQGRYQVAVPINIVDISNPGLEAQPELRRQAAALARIAIGLTHAQLGSTRDALDAFLLAADLSPTSEIVQFFLGREYLFLADREAHLEEDHELSAEQAFRRSIQLNPDYARGYVGVAGVYFRRSQRLFLETGSGHADFVNSAAAEDALSLVEEALHNYQTVLDLNPSKLDYGVPVDGIARLGMGQSYRIKGAVFQALGDLDQAERYYNLAVVELQPLIDLFEVEELDRYLIQSLDSLASAYFSRAVLFEVRQEFDDMLEDLSFASEYYGYCITRGSSSPDEVIRTDIAAARCEPFRLEVQDLIDNYSGGQG
jgi:tetratricopeptide (TPR) repeat protein/energy-coupling factor transporter ATP-binding protein EcfA2